MTKDGSKAGAALNAVIAALSPLDDAGRERVISSIVAFFNYGHTRPVASPAEQQQTVRPAFSEDYKPTPKEFLFQKQPKTDVERIACLAYYLTHFRDMPQFKTLDLAKLNTEAAQTKFSNAAYATNNATTSGYLAPAAKNMKQITAAGEQFVVALPDREAAKQAITLARRRKNARRKK